VPELRTPVASPAHEDTAREFAEQLAAVIDGASARRSARELLSLVWDATPGWIAAHADDSVPEAIRETALAAARRVAGGEPIAYACGRVAFRELVLHIDSRALIPRPETEIVVGEALNVCATGVAADIGTGSGAIALALATEGRFDEVLATDISTDALTLARLNVARARPSCPVRTACGSLFEPLGGTKFDLIVSNPPYIASGEMLDLPAAVHDWEPPVALVSGNDGLNHTARLVAGATQRLKPDGWLVLEVDPRRAIAVAALLAAQAGFTDVMIRSDLTGRPRVALARRTSVTTEMLDA
jgi:release factor glutamine methyltransferase